MQYNAPAPMVHITMLTLSLFFAIGPNIFIYGPVTMVKLILTIHVCPFTDLCSKECVLSIQYLQISSSHFLFLLQMEPIGITYLHMKTCIFPYKFQNLIPEYSYTYTYK